MKDIILTCVQCEADFVFSGSDRLRYERLGFSEPLRCPQCRHHKSKPNDEGERKNLETKKKHYRLKYY
ncbi:MAG: hypothetical protein AMJ54_13320 [Deltaproteobacteria bacterium SG8_13]|nr:MAG: hypothetical protein AMJ54_13320 [Deltaproteobacteria bacterium SG8_13]